MMGLYDGHKYLQFNSVAEFFDEILSRKYRNTVLYAHAGGIYDFNFLLSEIRDTGYPFKLISQGPRLIQISVKLPHRRRLVFRDSWAILANKLEKLGEVFQVDDKKLVGAIDFEGGERVNRNNPLHQEYLRRDCVCLHQVLKKYFSIEKIRKAGISATSASQAMLCFRRELSRPIRCTTDEQQNFVAQSYFGGRVEIFKMFGTDLNLYDANSLFPYAMLKPLPLEYICDVTDFGAFGFYDLELHAPPMYVPVLPQKMMGKLLFPTGEIRGTFFSEEIRAALSAGYRITKFHRGMAFSQSTDLFKSYIDYWYKMRQDNPGENPINATAKILLNSLYGKFGQNEDRVTLKTIEERDYKRKSLSVWHSDEAFKLTGLIEIEHWHRSPHQLKHIASAITSYGRLHMLPFYQAYADELYYTDTDSLFLKAELPTGKALGELKKENKKPLEGYFKLPKTYAIREMDGSNLKIKAKGFPGKYLEQVTFEDFKSKPLEFKRMVFAKFRTSVIRNNKFVSMVEIKRRLSSQYDKRRVFKSGDTEPWNIKKGVLK